MRNRLADWLDARTGYRQVLDQALNEPIPGGARWRYVWGSALTAAFGIQLLTGLLLMISYSPSATTAWGSVHYIHHGMLLGWFVRGLHHFGSQAMVVLLAVHLMQVLWAGAYRAPREVNWWFGMALLFLTLAFSLTGYLLPWDQKGYWATKVATNIMSGAPLIGPALQKVVVGGTEYGNQTLTRFYGLHVGLLPTLLVLCLVAHIALFRRHGVTTPRRVQGTGSFWPDQAFRDTVVILAVFGVLVLLVIGQHGAPLDAPANPGSSEYPARPEWYFLSLFQMLKLFPGEREIIGTIVIPTALVVVLLAFPLLDKVLPGRLAHFLACAIVFSLVGGASYLTLAALREDATNPKFQSARQLADEAAARALYLADQEKVPPDGAYYLLARDPLFHGRKVVLNQNCLTCHFYDGHGQITQVSDHLTPEEIAALPDAPPIPGLPRPASQVLAARLPGFVPKVVQAIQPQAGGVAADPKSYTVRGPSPSGDEVQVQVSADGQEFHQETESRQTASDLKDFGSRAWIRGLLEDPGSPTYFGKVPQCTGMQRWKQNSRLSAQELDDIADFFADQVITTPADLSPIEWEEQPAVQDHPGYAAFNKEGECTTCHADWSAYNEAAPNLFGWGSPRWIVRMVRRPGSPMLYGYLKDGQMPPFADLLTENDLTTLIRYLKGDFLPPPRESPAPKGSRPVVRSRP